MPRTKESAGILALAALISSCAAGNVIDDAPSRPAIASAATSAVRCPAATLTNEDPALREALRLAMAEACGILASQEFRRTVESLDLARRCPGLLGKHRLMRGAEIYRRLVEGMPDHFTVTAEALRGRTVAVTVASTRSMRVQPWKLTSWTNGTADDRAGTVNTLVHEMTHLVQDESQGSYFQDGWQAAPWCASNRLVSYRLGNEAEAQWAKSHRT